MFRGTTPAIDTRTAPRGLAVLEVVPVSETRQWVLIRSEDVSHPVVLFLHGGPGTSQLTLNRHNTRSLERHFTVVNWDQRGAGKSFSAGRDAARMTRRQFVDDVIDLASYLAERFGKRQVLLVDVERAGAETKYLLQHLDRPTQRPRAGERPVEFRAFRVRLAGEGDPRKILAGRDFQIWETLVVAQIAVELGLDVLDQPGFHQQGVDLAFRL
jgi:dipeptidyl aminopeptidase/acylaminoacyl peptidase